MESYVAMELHEVKVVGHSDSFHAWQNSVVALEVVRQHYFLLV